MAGALDILSVTPQRVRCYTCGKFSEDPVHWSYRLKLTGHSAVCPNCVAKAEHEISEQTSNPNIPGALALGAIAAVAGWVAWGACGRVKFAPVAGSLVGTAVVRGAGKKRGPWLQHLAAYLTVSGALVGLYLFANLALRREVGSGAFHWLSPGDFLVLYATLIMQGTQIGALIAVAIAVCCAFVVPRADRLVTEPPSKFRHWF